MNTFFVMLVVFYAGNTDGGVAVEKVGIFESQLACNSAALSAGFKKDFDSLRAPVYYCVESQDGYGAE